MRKPLVAAAAALIAIIGGSTTSGAINTYNATPAPERTEVGAYVALWDNTDDGVPDRFDWVCSGAMLDDDTFLTAAHCTTDWPEGTRHFVSLEQDLQSLLDAASGSTPAEQAQDFLDAGYIVEGDPIWDSAYPGPASDPHDIGILEFSGRQVSPADNQRWSFTPATLPGPGQLDEVGGRALAAAPWTVVGYGTEEALRGPGGQTWPGGGVRMKAPETFDALNDAWVRLDMHASRGNGGACYGDSGGPNFVVLGGQMLLAATTVTGDTPCYATNVTYRTDTEVARTFLASYVALPQ